LIIVIKSKDPNYKHEKQTGGSYNSSLDQPLISLKLCLNLENNQR